MPRPLLSTIRRVFSAQSNKQSKKGHNDFDDELNILRASAEQHDSETFRASLWLLQLLPWPLTWLVLPFILNLLFLRVLHLWFPLPLSRRFRFFLINMQLTVLFGETSA